MSRASSLTLLSHFSKLDAALDQGEGLAWSWVFRGLDGFLLADVGVGLAEMCARGSCHMRSL